MKLYKVISFICVIIMLNGQYNNTICETVKQNEIKEGAIEKFGNTSFIIKFTNLIYEKDDKQMMIPVFKGNMGDVLYKDFRNYCLEKKYLEPKVRENGFIIKTERGELTKTFRKFLLFYKTNILKNSDLNKPERMVVDGRGLYLFYEFVIDGVPFVFQIITTTREEYTDSSQIKSILNVVLDEKIKIPHFRYVIWKNYKSDEVPIL